MSLKDASFVQARRVAGLTDEVINDLAGVAGRKRLTSLIATTLIRAYGDMRDFERQQLRASLHRVFGEYAHWPQPMCRALENSRFLHVRFFLGDTYAMEGRYQDALRVFRRMKITAADHGDEEFCVSHIRLAYVLEQQNKAKEALRQLEALELGRPGTEQRYGVYYWWAHYVLGIVYRRLGRFIESSAVLALVKQYPGGPGLHVSALHQLGVTDFILGNLAEAEKKFLTCKDLRGNRSNDHRRAYEYRRLGQLYAITGRTDEAQAAFDESIRISARCGNIRYVRFVKQDLEKYVCIPDRIAEKQPEEIKLDDLAAQLQPEATQHEGGVEDIFRALRRHHLEYFDIFNPRTNRSTGTAVRADVAHHRGVWHATVLILLMDRHGRVALQQRGEQDSAGHWDVTASGHLGVSESDTVGAVREALEEVGIALMPDRLRRIGQPFQFRKIGAPEVKQDQHHTPFSYTYRTSKHNRECLSLFVAHLADDELGQLRPSGPDAAQAIEWQPMNEAVAWAKRRPNEFASGFKQVSHPVIIQKILAT